MLNLDSYRKVEPEHFSIDTVDKLPNDKPLGIFDLDGTLTRDDGPLLMVNFVQNVDFGSGEARNQLDKLFKLKVGVDIGYETYLEDTGRAYAQLLKSSGKRRSEVMKIADNFFRNVGYQEVLPVARPMISTLHDWRCDSVMVTGAPMEVADPFAAYAGIRNVFAMNAQVNNKGEYTGRMFNEHNTGLLTNKGAICRATSRRCATIFGAGNTQSDTSIMETAYLLGERNPIDMKGFAFLMNTGQIGDPIVERFMKSAGHRHAEFGYFPIPRNPDVPKFMEFFRALLRSTLVNNGFQNVVDEIEERRPMTEAEKLELKKLRKANPDPWGLTK